MGNPFHIPGADPIFYSLPEQWTRAVFGQKRALYDYKLFTKVEAIAICNLYLDSRKKRTWPLLMGMHPIMNDILKQRFSK